MTFFSPAGSVVLRITIGFKVKTEWSRIVDWLFKLIVWSPWLTIWHALKRLTAWFKLIFCFHIGDGILPPWILRDKCADSVDIARIIKIVYDYFVTIKTEWLSFFFFLGWSSPWRRRPLKKEKERKPLRFDGEKIIVYIFNNW